NQNSVYVFSCRPTYTRPCDRNRALPGIPDYDERRSSASSSVRLAPHAFGLHPPRVFVFDDGCFGGFSNGLIKETPKGSKSSTLRVTTLKPRTRAVAAMSASSRS